MKVCNIEGCNNPPMGRGLCNKHYSAWWRKNRHTLNPPCLIKDCSNPQMAKGLCEKHYRRQYRHGRITTMPAHQCSVPWCDKIVYRASMCPKHRLAKKHGRLGPEYENHAPYRGTICSSPECSKPANIKGYCRNHYHYIITIGGLGRSRTPTGRVRKTRPICKKPECGKPTYCKGLCHKHYTKTPHQKRYQKCYYRRNKCGSPTP
jgi:hypothetical protein